MNISKIIFKIKQNRLKPKERVLYAITKGIYIGSCVIFINPKEHPKNNIYAAIAIGSKNMGDSTMDGGMDAIQIPENDVINGLTHGILDKIKKIPKELYWLCCKEYEERVTLKEKSNESTN